MPPTPKKSNNNPGLAEAIWKDTIRKENQTIQISGNFGMNMMRCQGPASRIKHSHDPLSCVAAKVQRPDNATLGEAEDWDKSFEIKTIRHCDMTPQARWDMPQTTTQDLGWLLGNPALASELVENGHLNSHVHVSPPRFINGKYLPDHPLNNQSIPRSKSAQFLDPHLKIVSSKFGNTPFRNTTSSDVTKFSSHYVKAEHRSPFARGAGR